MNKKQIKGPDRMPLATKRSKQVKHNNNNLVKEQLDYIEYHLSRLNELIDFRPAMSPQAEILIKEQFDLVEYNISRLKELISS